MKYKVGDKVRIKSKEWWDAQPKSKYGDVYYNNYIFTKGMSAFCGMVAAIVRVQTSCNSYLLDSSNYSWFEYFLEEISGNDKSASLSEQLIKDIADVVKSRNLGVTISENEGKLVIEPLKVEEEVDLPIDTPCMCGNSDNELWGLRYYASKGKVYSKGLISPINEGVASFEYIIPFDKFNPNDIKESLKYNIVK